MHTEKNYMAERISWPLAVCALHNKVNCEWREQETANGELGTGELLTVVYYPENTCNW